MSKDYSYETYLQGKLINRHSITMVNYESPSFIQRIQGDICGSIHLATGQFRYFMVLMDTSARWSYVCMLSMHNVIFARLLAQCIKLRAFHICSLLDALCRCLLHCHKRPKWIPNVVWAFMLGIIHCPLLGSLNL